MGLRPKERIPLHNHRDFNSGGRIDGGMLTAILGLSAVTPPSTDGGGTTNNYYTTVPWIWVTDYGATGDGSTDDTAAIQAAIDAICAIGDGGTLYFPVGEYKITSAITISCGYLRLLGAGGFFGTGTTIRQVTDDTSAIVGSSTASDHLTVEGIVIEGPQTTQTTGYGVYAESSLHLLRSVVRGFYDSVHIDGSNGAAVYCEIGPNNLLGEATNDGLHLEGKVNNINVHGSRINNSGRAGIYISGGIYSGRIFGNSSEGNGTANIIVDGVGDSQNTLAVLISGNYLSQIDGSGTCYDLDIGPTTQVYGVDVIGNYFERTAVTGCTHIRANKVDRLHIEGGVIDHISEAAAITCDATNTTNVTLRPGWWTGTITTPASTQIIDPATSVTPASVGLANSAGTSKYLARADHVHQGSTASGGVGALLLASDKASPIVFDDILQASDGNDFLYASTT